MRWKRKLPLHYRIGESRTKNKFLIFPKCINNEWRWLEKTSWIQSVKTKYHGGFDYTVGWKDIRWID